MHSFIESFEEYLKADAEVVRLMHMDLDEDSLEYKMLSLLRDKVLVYEVTHFPVLYPNSPYNMLVATNKQEIDEVREECKLL